MIKAHSKNEFYVKKIRGGYYAVINGYDKSMESLEWDIERANKLAAELNESRNKRIN